MSGAKMKHVWMVEDAGATSATEAKSFWTKIGVAYENADGSVSLVLAAIPVTGRMQIRDPATPRLAVGEAGEKGGGR